MKWLRTAWIYPSKPKLNVSPSQLLQVLEISSIRNGYVWERPRGRGPKADAHLESLHTFWTKLHVPRAQNSLSTWLWFCFLCCWLAGSILRVGPRLLRLQWWTSGVRSGEKKRSRLAPRDWLFHTGRVQADTPRSQVILNLKLGVLIYYVGIFVKRGG